MSPAHWLASGHGNDAGFEDLQTDVMRFMAILAFCLMAVFALVQSFPLTAQPPPVAVPATATPQPAVSPNAAQAVTETAPRAIEVVAVPVTAPVADPGIAAPSSKPDDTPQTAAIQEKAPALEVPAGQVAAIQVEEQPLEAPPPPAEAPEEKPQGFTLRFVSDAALRRLVSRGKVGLYAFSAGQSWRLAPSVQADTFHAATAPKEFHAMATQTVPQSIVSAMRKQLDATQGTVTWGVTLPPPTRYAIARLVREFDGGVLIIGSDGRVQREEQ